MRRLGPLLALVLALGAFFLIHGEVWRVRAEVRQSERPGYVLPSGVMRILSLGNKGLLSDFLFLKTVTFMGDRIGSNQRPKEEDWQYIVRGLDTVTDLDPYFLDPYIFAEGFLVWDGGKYEEANRLLEKGALHRPDQWRLPFYIGFNHFYFLKDFQKGAEYIMKASRVPESPSFLPTLAARLGYYGGKSRTAVLFLKALLAETEDQRMRVRLEKRMLALERASHLEDLLEKYRVERGDFPKAVEALVEAGYVEQLPVDPYGGQWIIYGAGRVYSTSKFVESVPSQTPSGGKPEQ